MPDLPDATPRTFVAVDPTQRPVVRRSTVRVIVIDPAVRVLLFRDSDPNTGMSWWITPGGGIDPGEGEMEAVLRELAEETGRTFTEVDVLGPLARRHVVHGYSDRIVDQDDTFYAVRTPAFEVDTAGYTDEEKVTMLDHRWWLVPDILGTSQVIWPAVLIDLAAMLDQPSEWPIEIPDVEESSVAV